MPKRWNNGNLELSAIRMKRLQAQHRLPTSGPLEPLFTELRVAVAGVGLGDAPEPLLVDLGLGSRDSLWRDRWLGPAIFPQSQLTTHGSTTLADAEAHKLHVLYVTGDQVATKLEVQLAPRPGSDAEIDVTLELTVSALRAAGNELLDASLPERIQEQLVRFGEQLCRVQPGTQPPRRSTATATPMAHSSGRSLSKYAVHEIEVDQQDLVHDLEEMFALACPVAELKWIENWFFDLRHSESGLNEEHCVFVEALSAPLVMADRARTTWYTTLFDPQTRRFEAVLIMGDHILGKFDFAAEELGGGRARLRWELSFTGRNAKGDRLIAERGFRVRIGEMLEFLARSIEHYLTTGKLFRVSLHRKASLVASRLHTRLRRIGAPAARP